MAKLEACETFIHLMYGPELAGNSYFCFPESSDVSRDEVETSGLGGKQN